MSIFSILITWRLACTSQEDPEAKAEGMRETFAALQCSHVTAASPDTRMLHDPRNREASAAVNCASMVRETASTRHSEGTRRVCIFRQESLKMQQQAEELR